MKHWHEDKDGNKASLADDDGGYTVLSVSKNPDGTAQFTELCDNFFSRQMPRDQAIEALEELIAWLRGPMSELLKPCPFCGSKPVYKSDGGYNTEIRCQQCRQAVVKASWYGGDLGTTEEAWNKRAI